MKHLLAIILLNSFSLFAWGQSEGQWTFFQTRSKIHLYYVDLRYMDAIVYEMGSYLDKAGTGYSIRDIDTLNKLSEGTYAGKDLTITREGNQLYLVAALKRTKKLVLDTVRSLPVVYHNLNNAYYLDQYFKMSDALNKAYPLNHHSFRHGFDAWKELPDKETDHLQFRAFASKRLEKIKDSINHAQDAYVVQTNHLVQNIRTLDYPALKDSLLKLPAVFRYESGYYATVVNEVAKQRPEYFFRLAEDYPAHRNLVFRCVEDNKEVMQGLKAVEGHSDIKKEFFKDRKFSKSIPYRIVGIYAVIAGLITLLIVSQ